jgi:hypothetical protein
MHNDAVAVGQCRRASGRRFDHVRERAASVDPEFPTDDIVIGSSRIVHEEWSRHVTRDPLQS